jgi:transcription elongation factor GreA
MDSTQMTAEGLKALHEEVEKLENEGRNEIAGQIKTAREWGDLKENGEYHAAKEAQAHLETRIKKLRERIQFAEVVEVAAGAGAVGFGSVVEVEDEATSKSLTYTIVAQHEAAPANGLLSAESPVAVALQGKSPGDVAKIPTPSGERRFKVLKVS